MQGGNITLSFKYKYNDITDIQVWTAAFFVYTLIYVLAYPDCSSIQVYAYYQNKDQS